MKVLKTNGQLVELDINKIHEHVAFACEGLEGVSQSELESDSHITFYEGMPTSEIQKTLILTAADKIRYHYNWHYVAARLLLLHLFKQVTGGDLEYPALRSYIENGVAVGGLDPELLDSKFDFDRLDAAIDPSNDRQFTYLGLSILSDRYFRRNTQTDRIIELPQHFYMRVAMGLTLKGAEADPTSAAIEFYHTLSSFDFHNSTPTLFNAGTLKPQLSSCYLLSMGDSIEGITGTCTEAGHYSKLSGGIGIDMSPVRSSGSLIAGTGGRSGGIIPFAKMAEATITAFNQMGKRKGAGALYLSDWHPDIEAFLELKNETGDPRQRTPDLQTAVWLSEILLARKDDPEAMYSLMDPCDSPELLETYGDEFREIYERLESEGKYRKQIRAKDLWKKIIASGYETGSYYHGNKDMINRRRMQKDTGIVRSSNLCCMTADQRVSTNLGMLTVGDLYALQQEVRTVGVDGYNQSSVMYLPRPDAPIVKIVTYEGYTHKVTPDHKVLVKGKGMVEAQDLEEGDLLVVQSIEGEFGPMHSPELAFLYGLLASDGTINSYSVRIDMWSGKNNSEWLRDKVVHCMHICTGKKPIVRTSKDGSKSYIHSAELYRIFKDHIDTNGKVSIPEFVWRGDKDTVAAFLEGAWSGDGTAQATKELTTSSLSSVDLAFLQDVQILLSNLAIKSSISIMRGESSRYMPDGKGGTKEYACQAVYRLLITSKTACRIFEYATNFVRHHRPTLSCREQFLDNVTRDGYVQKFAATFSHLEPLPNEDAYCLEVYHDDHAWSVNGLITKNTEITLNTAPNEVSAVCNIGSINLSKYRNNDTWLKKTVRTAVRMLDNVVSIGLVPHENGRRFQNKERAIGLGIMGETEWLAQNGIRFDTVEHLRWTAEMMKKVSRYAIEASADLAQERGAYELFPQSEWAKGVLPYDTAPTKALDLIPGFEWYYEDDTELRAKTSKGMRNSHVMAIAPTATISHIVGTTSCTELPLELVDVKENLSGNFIDRAPTLKYLSEQEAQTARDVNQYWVIAAGGVRQVYIDQGQSTNIYLPIGMQYADGTQVRGSTISDWRSFAMEVLKTTYYLRGVNAGAVRKTEIKQEEIYCSIENPEACESCQ